MADPPEQSPDGAGQVESGSRRTRTRGYIDDFGEGRVCATDGCDVVLSRYNSGGLCWTHEASVRTRDAR